MKNINCFTTTLLLLFVLAQPFAAQIPVPPGKNSDKELRAARKDGRFYSGAEIEKIHSRLKSSLQSNEKKND